MKSLCVLVLLVLASSLEFSCKSKDSPTGPILPTIQDTSLIPLSIGNFWEYSDSVFYSPDSIVVYHYTWSVVAKQNIYSKGDSVEVYIFRINFVGDNQYDYFYKVTSQGLVQYGSLELDTAGHYSLQSLMLKFPLQPGDTWSESHGDYADQKACLSVDTVIVTSLGNFHCYVIRTGPGVTWYGDEYYRLNFGLVGGYADTKIGNTHIIQKTTLLSFALH
jgi:hypothetical protein